MVGLIKINLELYLECDVENEEAKACVKAITERLEGECIDGVYVSEVKVEDKTFYEDNP